MDDIDALVDWQLDRCGNPTPPAQCINPAGNCARCNHSPEFHWAIGCIYTRGDYRCSCALADTYVRPR